MANIAQILMQNAVEHPSKVFCNFMRGHTAEAITFEELFRRSCAYARKYGDMGVRAGDVIVIILKHTPHQFYSYLGAIIAGAVPSFMPFPTPRQRHELYWADMDVLFNRIEPALLVSYQENILAYEPLRSERTLLTLEADDSLVVDDAGDCDFAGFDAAISDIACLQHSSGTTNTKKGVMLTHAALIESTRAYSSRIGQSRDDVIASWLPLYHDMGFVACFMSATLVGSQLIAIDPFEWVVRPQLLLDAISRFGATLCWLPNFAFLHLARAVREHGDLSSIRAFINCSEPCKPEAFTKFLETFSRSGITSTRLQVCYAMAENTFAVTQTSLAKPPTIISVDAFAYADGLVRRSGSDKAIELISCGTPIDLVNLEIADRDGTIVGEGVIGEIHIRGPYLFEGYHKLPELTKKALRGGTYATGDLGFLFEGELFVTGRVDDLLIVSGRNYYAHDLEGIVSTTPGVVPGRVLAFALDDPISAIASIQILCECAAGEDDQAIARAIRSAILERVGLSVHSVKIAERGSLVKTTSGKLSRSKNLELLLQGKL